LRDSTLINSLTRTAEDGTSGTTIEITDHGMAVGDYVYNDTLGMVFWVVSITDANNFVINDTGDAQTSGDSIVTYPGHDETGINTLKKQGIIPKTVSYTIDHIFMDPQMKQKIDLPRSGVAEGYYNIESVNIKAVGAGFYESTVTAILRDETDFSTQNHAGYNEFFRGFLGTSKRAGYGPNFGALNKAKHVGATAPSDPKENDEWVDTSTSSYKYWDGASWVPLISGGGGGTVTNGDSHDHVGGDGAAIAEGAFSFTDVTTANTSTSKHGLCPKLNNDDTKFLDGKGNWTTPGVGSVFLSGTAT
jgi:hypothetical protein